MRSKALEWASPSWRPARSYVRRHWLRLPAISAGLIAFAFLLIKTTWLSEDAYITFNIQDDDYFRLYELTWNIDGRV